MRRLALSSVRHNRGRYIATLVAIITGVAFYAATGFVSTRVINSLEGDVNQQYGNVDAAVVVDPDKNKGSNAGVGTQTGAKLPEATVKRLLALDGVQGGAGELTGKIAFLGRNGKPFAKEAVGRLAIDDPELNPLDYTAGRAPAAAGEIAIDRGLADTHGLKVGDTETVLTLAGRFPATIVGINRFGSSDALDQGGTITVPKATAFRWLNSGQREYDAFYLRGSADQQQLRDAAAPLLPAAFKVDTGEDFRADKRASVGAVGRYLKYALQGFAVLALLVGGFVIFNTFSVIVAQRLRELAVLAAVGATPKQLKRSLRLEGLFLGLIGSALGVAAGFGLTFLLIVALKAFGVELPGSGIAIGSGTVVSAIFIGTVITVVSVSIPARRAARTEPIEALRDAASETAGPSRRRGIVAGSLVGLGLLGLFAGPKGGLVGLGALAFIAGVLVAGPFIALGGTRIARPLLSRFGIEGRLAADNATRNPQRTATTANALLIGVFLVTLVAVSGTSIKDFAVGEINKLESADYLLISTGGTIDPKLVGDLKGIDGVHRVVPFRNEVVSQDKQSVRLSTGDLPVLQDIANIEVAKGSLDDLGPGKIAVLDQAGAPRLGTTVKVADNSGEAVNLKVVALLKPSIDASVVGSVVDRPTFDKLVGDVAPTVAFVDLRSGAQTSTRHAIQRRVDLRPDIDLQEGNAVGRIVGSIFDFMINAVIGLLLMSVVIALIGIINTLSLSILERRRELGLLRVIGMTDDRVQRMVRIESLLISGLGTVSGMAAGLIMSAGLVLSINRLSEASVALSFPFAALLGVLVAGVVLGVLASLLPSRRSTRLEVLDAIGSV